MKMHVCMLESVPGLTSIQPLTSRWKVFRSKLRNCLLPAAWHHGSKLLFSEKRLAIERDRQVKSGHWMMIHPYSPLKFYWDCYLLVIIAASLFYLPVQVFDDCKNTAVVSCCEGYCDIFATYADFTGYVSIIVNFFSAYVDDDGKKIILNPASIAKKYIRDTFFIDIFANIPEHCYFFPSCNAPLTALAYLLKTLRLIHFDRLFKNVCLQCNFSFFFSTLSRVWFMTIYFFHWMTSFHYLVPIIASHFLKPSARVQTWLIRFKYISGSNGTIPTQVERYITHLYYVTGLCWGVGTFSVEDEFLLLPLEAMLSAFVGLVGLVVMTCCYTTLLRLMLYKNYEQYMYYGRLKEIAKFLASKRVPTRLCRKIQLYINYVFCNHYFHEQALLNTLNEQIKQEINMFSCKKLVLNVPLFQDLPITLINTIIFCLNKVLYMPGEVVVTYGHPSRSLYLISSGTVAVMDKNGREVAHLKDGAHFGERALLQPGTLRTATIVALEITEIYKLNSAQFRECLNPVPRIKRHLFEEAETILRRSSDLRRRLLK